MSMSSFNAFALTRSEMKKIKGGDGCGVKVGGVWYPSSNNYAGTKSLLGKNVKGTYSNHPGYVYSPDGFTGYTSGSFQGTVTNWCCSSCYWNNKYT